MPITSKLKVQVDVPAWEMMRFLPVSSAAAHCMTTGDTLTERYLYYSGLAAFYRYDTYTDSWQQLAGPPVAGLTVASIRYSVYSGNWGRVLAAGASSVTLPGLSYAAYQGFKIRIVAGTGAGQERTITACADAVIADQGVVTGASATNLADSTKKWQFNQWQGYYVGIEHSSGLTQHKKVIYNDSANLYFNDANYQAIDHWNNTGFSAVSPYLAPTATAGAQSHYLIKSQVCTVDSPWTVQPDSTSRYTILSGGVWLISSASATPFYTFQFYDVLTDTWLTKTAAGGIFATAIATDVSIERISEASSQLYASGTATSGGARTLTNTGASMTVDRWVGYQLRITGGTGIGQRRWIVANGTNYFEVERQWDTQPNATSTYAVYGDSDKIYMQAHAQATLHQYSVYNDIWAQGRMYDYGIARNAGAQLGSYEAFGITSITRNTGGITAFNSTPTAGGTGYVVGDILTVTTGGTNGKAIVTSTVAGVVSTIALLASGSGYTTGTGKATSGGTGSGCTVEITSIGVVGRAVTALNHNIKTGETVTMTGWTEGLWNAAYTVIGVDSLTGFDVATSATANGTASNSQSTTVLVDSTKNWATNEHQGRIVHIMTAGPAGTVQSRRIVSNTATTLTLQTAITAAVNGTSRYVIQDIASLGKDRQTKVPSQDSSGQASSGSTTTLVDSSKAWKDNQWASYRIRIIAGTGLGNEFAITSNTPTTLTYSTQPFTPDTTTRYMIMDTYGVSNGTNSTTQLQDTTKNWTVNQWAGKRVRITSGTNQHAEYVITSNTANTLVWAAAVAPDTNSTYSIMVASISAAFELQWAPGLSNSALSGRYLIRARAGGSNTFDRYDISRDIWEFAFQLSPQSETLTAGSMYVYDGVDSIYYTNNVTGRLFAVNVLTGKVTPAGMIPYGMNAAVVGNRMEIIQTADGLKYLYLVRHSGTEFFRTLLFW